MHPHAPRPDASLHEKRLAGLAAVAVQVGLGLQRGQELVVTAPIEAVPLVRLVTQRAYQAGASLVTTLFADDEATLLRFRHAPPESFDKASDWLFEGMAKAFRNGAARLAIVGEDPALLAGQDPDKVARANRARSRAYMPALELIAGFDINWSIVSYATPAWARSVFPNMPEGEAVERLWDAIFAACRVDRPDPVAAWERHNRELRSRTDLLNDGRYAALHFRGPGTDLTVGLADDHQWEGGAAHAKNGVLCNPNIPSEEVFTTPHRDRVLETDEGARRLGEVALVPHSSPISRSGLLFYNTLFDENAASHIALGQAYSKCFRDGDKLSEAELAGRGANRSLIHIDWMIGSDAMDVDGIAADGLSQPLMRRGEWVI